MATQLYLIATRIHRIQMRSKRRARVSRGGSAVILKNVALPVLLDRNGQMLTRTTGPGNGDSGHWYSCVTGDVTASHSG